MSAPSRASGILSEIVAHKHAELAAHRVGTPEDVLRAAAGAAAPARDFQTALQASGISVIAEVKGASPSAGVLRADLHPADLARAYEAGGAAALSVLTDRRFFSGDRAHLAAARDATALPVLRKDFTLTDYHVFEARAMGADAILLIAAILDDDALRGLRRLAESMGMAALVEVHTEPELDRAIGSGARIVGINNRDLNTFAVSLETTLRLRPRVPASVAVVSESGIAEPEHMRILKDADVDAVLIGSALVTDPDPAARLRTLRDAAK